MNTFGRCFIPLRELSTTRLVAGTARRKGLACVPGIARLAGLVMTLACVASASSSHPAFAQYPDGVQRLVPVPTAGVEVELWSDPPAGSLVDPGTSARLYVRANADCYLTVFSVDTEGRVRLLSPRPFEDGWVSAGRTYRFPESGSGFDLRFAGPPGMEYVYALASLHPTHSRYPSWMTPGMAPMPPLESWDDDSDVYRRGRVMGDPFYQVRDFCEELVPYPQQRDAYATAWVYFHLGRRVPYPRFLCSDCHGGGAVDPYGPACRAVRVRAGDAGCSGRIDFRLSWYPQYTYEVWTGWRPRTWHGGRWNGPDGRWVWSSADGRRVLRRHFLDACPPNQHGPGPRGRDFREDGSRRDERGGRFVVPPADPRADPRIGREVRPPRPKDDNVWGRGFEERLRRAVGEKEERRGHGNKPEPDRPRGPEVRNAEPGPGVPTPKPPAPPERGDRDRGQRGPKDSPPKSPERPSREGHGRSR